MQGELSELDCQSVITFEFFDTPGDEIAPGSNEVRKDFEHKRLRHGRLLAEDSDGFIRFYVCSSVEVKGRR
jgi:hypothetical protein